MERSFHDFQLVVFGVDRGEFVWFDVFESVRSHHMPSPIQSTCHDQILPVVGVSCAHRIIFYQDDVMASAFLKACLGMACVMYWFALIQYLEFFPRYVEARLLLDMRFGWFSCLLCCLPTAITS